MSLFKWTLLLTTGVPVWPQAYEPPTIEDRTKWFVHTTYGPRSLFVSGPITSGLRTWRNSPEEWGPGWKGFGKRYGARLLNNSVMNGIEASAGAVWGEDPRYQRAPDGSTTKQRLGYAMKQVFLSRYEDGRYRFGFAKAAGITGGAFAQKAWMPDSIASNNDAFLRVGNAYVGRAIGNLFREFGPMMMKKFKKN